MCQAYFEARADYEFLKDQAESAERKKRALESQLVEIMEQIGDSNFLKDGMRVGTRKHFGISVTLENSDAWCGWLTERFGDDAPFLKQVVDKSTLTSQIKDKLEAGSLSPDDIPEWANLKVQPIITVSGWKK